MNERKIIRKKDQKKKETKRKIIRKKDKKGNNER